MWYENIFYDESTETNLVLLMLVYFYIGLIKLKEVWIRINLELQVIWNGGGTIYINAAVHWRDESDSNADVNIDLNF